MQEIDRVTEIYQLMGFDMMESRQLDDEFHMFDSLNFAKEHPARDGYDTFRTEEGLIPPAHTSTMQNRALKKYKHNFLANLGTSVLLRGFLLVIPILFSSVVNYATKEEYGKAFLFIVLTLTCAVLYRFSECLNRKIFYNLCNVFCSILN